MYVDLSCNINRTFLSADKCTKTVISITEAILDKTQGCLLVDLLVSIRLPPMIHAKVRPVVTGKIIGNRI